MQLRKTLENIGSKLTSILEIIIIPLPFVLFGFIAVLLFYLMFFTTVQSDPVLEAVLKAIFTTFQNSIIFNIALVVFIFLIIKKILQKHKDHIIDLFIKIPKHENKLSFYLMVLFISAGFCLIMKVFESAKNSPLLILFALIYVSYIFQIVEPNFKGTPLHVYIKIVLDLYDEIEYLITFMLYFILAITLAQMAKQYDLFFYASILLGLLAYLKKRIKTT